MSLRELVLKALIALGVVVAAVTEILGLLGWLAFGAILATWSLIAIAGLAIAARGLSRAGRLHCGWPLRGRPVLDIAMVAWIGLSVIATCTMALFAAPTTWDGLPDH